MEEYNISWYGGEEDNGRRRTSDWIKVNTSLQQKMNIYIRRPARKRSSEEDKKIKWWVAPPAGKRTCKLRLHMLTHIFTAYQLWQITWHTLTNHITEHRSCITDQPFTLQNIGHVTDEPFTAQNRSHYTHWPITAQYTFGLQYTVDVPYINHTQHVNLDRYNTNIQHLTKAVCDRTGLRQ